jgi:phage portal protein BeeE
MQGFFMKFLKTIWPQRLERKSSSVASYIAYNSLGKAVWTPRNYNLLADEGYQKNVIVYRCVSLIARGVGSVPWLLYDHDHEIEKHPLLDLLNCPSPRQAGSSFMESIVGHLMLAGNAYIEAISDQSGRICELYSLRPDRMKVIPSISGVPAAFEYEVDGRKRVLESDPITGSFVSASY